MKRNCDYCGTEYEADMRNINRGWGLCCSKKCAANKREQDRIQKGGSYSAEISILPVRNISTPEDKILFLDLDGVMNSQDSCDSFSELWKLDKSLKSRDEFIVLFDERCVRWLRYIILKTQCRIVISSDRRSKGLDFLQTMWEVRDLPGEVIDVTPLTASAEMVNLYACTSNEADRGYEIQEWLDTHKHGTYCIVDDHSDMLPHQLKYFVQTDGNYGLTFKKAKEIVMILNSVQ